MSHRALVSICIPVFNRARYIDETLRSALGQTYEPLELVVVDDGSRDDTVARVRSHADPRLRLYVNEHNLGMTGNGNRALALARGQLIKFLDSDDVLAPDCVTKMARFFMDDPAVGLVFSRRRIAVDPAAQEAQAWLTHFSELHTHFQAIGSINDGRALLSELLAAGLPGNWIGEPSAVMVRRAHLDVSGGFAHHVQHCADLDLWVRILPHSLVGFIDEQLVTYRWGHESESTKLAQRRNWIDRLWLLEALALDTDVRRAYPQVDDLRRVERKQTYRTALRCGRVKDDGRFPVAPYLRYARFRILAALGREPELFATLPRTKAWAGEK